MRLSDPIKMSLRNLLAAKARSFLTILGIIIGIASVIIILGIGTSAQQLILSQVRGVGSNLIAVLPGGSEEKGPPAQAFGVNITTLKYSDLKALLMKQNVPNVLEGCGYVNGTKTVQYLGINKNYTIRGTSASYINVENTSLSQGDYFSKEQEVDNSRVAVLGSDVANDLFGSDIDPIGKKIKIGGDDFTVIGVLARRGSSALANQDNAIFIPLFTAQKIVFGIDYLNFIRLKIDDEKNIDQAIADIKTTMRERHNIKDPADDDFSVRDQRVGLEIVTNVTGVITYFLAAIAAISLLVGGVGIMNTMLISVNQRIREIGLRKALGAKNSTILFQFLVESVIITFIGGLAGIVSGTFILLIAALIIQKLGYDWPFIITMSSILIAVSISFLVGIFFGIYPARKAARLNITEALRYE